MAADRALLQALQASRGELQAAVLQALLGRKSEAVRRNLIHFFSALDRPAWRVLQQDPAALESLARLGMQDTNPAVRLDMLTLLESAGVPSCAYLLSGAATDTAAVVRLHAAKALVALVRKWRGDVDQLTQHVVPAVAHALRGYEFHESPAVLRSAILLGFSCGAEILEQLERQSSRLAPPLSHALGEMPAAESAGFVFSILRSRKLSEAARAFLSQASWSVLGGISAQGHWLLLGPVRRSLAEVRTLRAVVEDPTGLNELPSAQQPACLRLVMASGLAQGFKDAVLGVAIMGGQPTALAALPYVLERGEKSVDLLLMALHSPHPDVQALAAAHIVASGADALLTEHLLGLLSSLQPPLRAVLGQYLVADGFDRYWRSYKRLDSEVRDAAGRALLKLDGRVVDLLAGRLVSRSPAEQLQATQMIRQFKMVPQFEPVLCKLARSGDRVVRSSAVSALGMLSSFESRSALARCLEDADARVQANAVEALAARGGDPSIVLDKIHSNGNRVRGNALHWLLREKHPQAELALAAMLTDTRPPHRISALWVVQSLKYAPAAGILRRLALEDTDPKVRARAATILRDLGRPAFQEAAP